MLGVLIGAGVSLYNAGKARKQAQKIADAAAQMQQEQLEENRRLQALLEEAKIQSIEDLQTLKDQLGDQLSQFEMEQAEIILRSAQELNISIDEGFNLLNEQIEQARESELSALISSGKLSMDALQTGYQNAQGQLATSQAEILQNLQDNNAISRRDIEQARDFSMQVFESEEAKVLEDMVSAGIITEDQYKSGALSSIGSILGFSKRAIDSLTPQSLAGRRALAKQKIITGIATQEEVEDFTNQFGDPTGFTGSPLYQFQLEEQEKAITRMQKARGSVFSGAGARELLQEGTRRLAAEESERQYQRLEGLRAAGQQADRDISSTLMQTAQLGQQAQQQRSQVLAGISSRSGEQLSEMEQNLSQMEANVRQRYGLSLADLEVQFGREKAAQIANQAVRENRVRDIYSGLAIQSQADASAARTNVLAQQQAQQMALGSDVQRQQAANLQNIQAMTNNIRTGTSSEIVRTQLQGQQMASQLGLQAGDYSLQAATIPYLASAATTNTLASLGGQAAGQAAGLATGTGTVPLSGLGG